ncbi:MAG TPA: toxin TcdB middle/N-terminal domain-containing protein, partial [Candidatus Binatia bacterium]|nr:toxin TcdB middle/N-terminal domain-containing protein [Candidatus Binatia bacterium]
NFDYGEGHYTEDAPDEGRIFARAQINPPAESHWPVRQDPFSTYRAGFEVRTYRLCHRVLMFHHFPQELGIDDCLVRSTEFSYAESPIASFISSVTQSGYVRQEVQNQPNRYLKQSLPPLEFEYSQVKSPEELAQQPIREVDAESLENLPVGLDGASYQWMDLDGEGIFGILTEQADGWYYKRNLSANNLVREDGHERTVVHFGPMELVASQPAVGLAGGGQFLDLAGDGQVDLVQMEGPVRGFYERTEDASWAPFQPFVSWPDLSTRDPDLRFVDLTGDGHADILITEGEALTWYPSLAEEGFRPAVRVSLPSDEEKGPQLVFADGAQSIYLADVSGDGLSDLVRIRNGEVCYWPNLGYGRFGAKVTMDNAPWFDSPDHFDQRRIRLADSDGSGTTDMLYLRRDGLHIYFNQSGNRWSNAVALPQFPPSDTLSSVQALDLLGNGTACLVWSSPLPGAARRPMRYLALMQEKPHLLVAVKNNLGTETKVHYAPSTKFYLNDKRDGKPWVTRLPFPVHVVERVEIYDHISRNHFVTRYAYHHGYFDGVEREFRGFGVVEQWDTEEFAALA